MKGQTGQLQVGAIKVVTTSGRGLTPEEWADRCLLKIIHVGDQAIPAIRDQALAYKEQIRKVLVEFIRNAIKSDRTTLYNLLLKQGHKDMAEIIRKFND